MEINFAWITTVFFLSIGGFVWYRAFRLRKRKKRLINEVGQFFDHIQRLDGTLRPYLVYDKGVIGERIAALKQESSSMLDEKFEMEQAILQETISLRNYKETLDSFDEKSDAIEEMNKKITDAFIELRDIKKKVEVLNKTIMSKRNDLEMLHSKFKEATRKSNYKLQDIEQKINDLFIFLKHSENLPSCDPLKLKDQVELKTKQIVEIEKDIDMILKIAQDFDILPQKIKRVYDAIYDFIEEEKMDKYEDHVYKTFSNIEDMQYRLQYYLEFGKKDECLKTLRAIYSSLETIMNETKNMEKLKKENEESIEKIEKELKEMPDDFQFVFEDIYQKMQEKYEENHWNMLPQSFKTLKEYKDVLTILLTKIKELNTAEKLAFTKAREGIDKAFVLIKEFGDKKAKALNAFSTLEDRFNQLQGSYKEAKNKIKRILENMEKHHLPKIEIVSKGLQNINQSAINVENFLKADRYNIDLLSEEMTLLNRYIYETNERVNDIITNKTKAENQFIEMKSLFSKCYNQYHRQIDIRTDAKNYQIHILKAEEYIERAIYRKAIEELEHISEIISDMTSVYQDEVAKAKNEEEEKDEHPKHSVVDFVTQMEKKKNKDVINQKA